jgi:Zn-dependent protease with chaperone function
MPISMINAFCTEDGNIYITKPMITRVKLNEGEQLAIILHEIGHAHQKVGWVLREVSEHTSKHLSVALVSSLLSRIPTYYAYILASLIFNILLDFPLSRFYEYDADGYAAKKGYGKQLASAFKKMMKYELEQMNRVRKHQGMEPEGMPPDPTKTDSALVKTVVFFNELLSTHPNTYKRIKHAIEKDMEKNPKSTSIKDTVAGMMSSMGYNIKNSMVANAISKVKSALFS